MESVRIGIVGGSIAGCLTAATLARAGFDAVIMERSPTRLQERGAGLTLPLALLENLRQLGLIDGDLRGPSVTRREWRVRDGEEALGRLAFTEPMLGAEMQHWGALFQSLRRRVDDARYLTGVTVTSVRTSGKEVALTFADRPDQAFDLVVGADGYRSAIRAALFPDAEPTYAGYSAWRGMIPESMVADASPVEGATQMAGVPRGHIGIYFVPGADGDSSAGKRNLNWVLYDGAAPPEIAGVTVAASGRATAETVAPGQLSEQQLSHLHALAGDHLPPWHRDVVIKTPAPYLQSVFDLSLERIVDGRICLVGDAAMIARPHTGSGVRKAALDALALSEALTRASSPDEGLRGFERARVEPGRALVELGKELGSDQVMSAPDWNALDRPGYEELLLRGAASRTYFGRSGTAAAPE